MRSTSKLLKILPSTKLKPRVYSTLRLVKAFLPTDVAPCSESTELTVPFVNQGKAKKRAWQKVVDEGITPAAAEEKYIELVESLKGKYGYDADKEPEPVGRS